MLELFSDQPRYIPPASPQHNGRHERMHRTLKAETTRPPARCAKEQQQRFNRFRDYYNHERPHEALDQKMPGSLWRPSSRLFAGAECNPWYDAERLTSSSPLDCHIQLVYTVWSICESRARRHPLAKYLCAFANTNIIISVVRLKIC